jgi:AraC-like DNA-binding protein
MPPDMPPPQWEASLQVRSDEKYPGSQILMTSRELGWANISAEVRSHPRGIITSCSGGDTELMLLLRGRSRITRAVGTLRVCEFIAANLERELHLEQLAQVACLSQFHFARAFKKATGHTVHQYLTTARLERAKELLAADESSIADIAFQCSFSSQANFTKVFVRWLGISPGRYRRACAFPVLPLRADSAVEMFG